MGRFEWLIFAEERLQFCSSLGRLRVCVKSIDWPRGYVFVSPAKAGAQMPPLVDTEMTLDSGLRRNDGQGIMLCPDIFEHRL